MELISIFGKVLFGFLFFTSGIGHFKARKALTGYAKAYKLPYPEFCVLSSGVLLIVAPVLYLFGIAETLSLSALALFLTATAYLFHPFWKETDPTTKMNEQIAFNKEISLVGLILVVLTLL